MHRLFNGDCLEILPKLEPVNCIFADPPDGIGLKYDHFKDQFDLGAVREICFAHLARSLLWIEPTSFG